MMINKLVLAVLLWLVCLSWPRDAACEDMRSGYFKPLDVTLCNATIKDAIDRGYEKDFGGDVRTQNYKKNTWGNEKTYTMSFYQDQLVRAAVDQYLENGVTIGDVIDSYVEAYGKPLKKTDTTAQWTFQIDDGFLLGLSIQKHSGLSRYRIALVWVKLGDDDFPMCPAKARKKKKVETF